MRMLLQAGGIQPGSFESAEGAFQTREGGLRKKWMAMRATAVWAG